MKNGYVGDTKTAFYIADSRLPNWSNRLGLGTIWDESKSCCWCVWRPNWTLTLSLDLFFCGIREVFIVLSLHRELVS